MSRRPDRHQSELEVAHFIALKILIQAIIGLGYDPDGLTSEFLLAAKENSDFGAQSCATMLRGLANSISPSPNAPTT